MYQKLQEIDCDIPFLYLATTGDYAVNSFNFLITDFS